MHDEAIASVTGYADRGGPRRRLTVRSKVTLSAGLLAAIGAGLVATAPAHGQSTTPCQTIPAQDVGTNGLRMTTASLWRCAGDLVPPNTGTSNGGPVLDTNARKFGSSHLGVEEECGAAPNQNTCGRGEFGYGGGELPFGSALLDNVDPATWVGGSSATPDQFACPVAPDVTGSNYSGKGFAAPNASGTTTTNTAGSANPALLLHAGTFSASSNNTFAVTSGDTQCYDPYVSNAGGSAAMGGGVAVDGKAYGAACLSYAPCPGGAGFGASVIYIPENSSAGASCKGRVLAAGGWKGDQDVATAALYDPRLTVGGIPGFNASFNTWTTISSAPAGYSASLSQIKDSALVVQLNATQWLIAGGETESFSVQGGTPTGTVDIFDSTQCAFKSAATLTSARYDSGGAKFADGKVLICGGTTDFVTFGQYQTCELYTPSSNTWASGPTLTESRARLFGQFLPGTVTSSNATGDILMAGGNAQPVTPNTPTAPNSDECSETVCTASNVALWDNHCSTSSLGCANTPQNDLGYTPQPNTDGIQDSSHLLIGYNPAETTTCSVGGNTFCPKLLAGELSSTTWDGLVLACGGFGLGYNATGGNDTMISCEYYVPSGVPIPSAFNISGGTFRCGNNAPSQVAGVYVGPVWCTTPGTHLNRERGYFNLVEVPASSGSVGDSFLACGGFYGVIDYTFEHHAVRKNCESLAKGTT